MKALCPIPDKQRSQCQLAHEAPLDSASVEPSTYVDGQSACSMFFSHCEVVPTLLPFAGQPKLRVAWQQSHNGVHFCSSVSHADR